MEQSHRFDVGLFKDKNIEYLQPPKRPPLMYRRPYGKPKAKMDLNTTYDLSYMYFDNKTYPRLPFKDYGRTFPFGGVGNFDFETITKLSYMPVKGKVRKPFYPRSYLAMKGSHNMITTQALSYSDPGIVKTLAYKPVQNSQVTIPMNCTTTAKESYKPFGHLTPVRKFYKPRFWQTQEKTDYHTITKLSYQNATPQLDRVTYNTCYRPRTTGQMEKCTTYDSSYQVPGIFRARR